MSSNCPSCGAGIAAGETICMECGTELVLVVDPVANLPSQARPVAEETTEADVGARECPDCLSMVTPDRNGLCFICGHDFSEDELAAGFDEHTFFAEPASLDELRAAQARSGRADAASLPITAPPAAAPAPLPLPSDRVRTRFQGGPDSDQPPLADTGATSAACLIVEGGQTVFFDGEMTSTLPLDVDQVLIGRRDPSAGHYPEVDLTHLAQLDPHISRRHARVIRTRAGYFIEDLCTNDATFLNDRAHVLNGERHELHDGDRILISDAVAMRFHLRGR